MKKMLLLLLFCVVSNWTFAQSEYQLEMLDNWDNDNLPTHFFGTFNDCWGYVADGREYAIMGSSSHVHIFDITDPSTIIEITQIFLGPATTWRDFKVYGNRLYSMADSSNEGLSIIDLSELPTTATLIKQDNSVFSSAHNLYIEVEQGRLYVVGGPTSLLVYDLTADPDNPTLLRALDLVGTYIHDIYVRDNIAYCSSANDGLYIWDLNNVENPILLASLLTNGYNHSNWLSDDGQTLIVAEEVPLGLPLLTIDVSKMLDNDLEIQKSFQEPNIMDAATSSDVTPHNPYIMGDKMFCSYYEDGLHVYDWSDPANPVKIATYDTYPENDDPGSSLYGYNDYSGNWGVYPFMPSGTIIVSDLDHGLFLLRLTESTVSTQNIEGLDQLQVFPNPTLDQVNVSFRTSEVMDLNVQVTDLTGKVLISKEVIANGDFNEQLDMSHFAKGMYFLSLTDGAQTLVKKLTKM